MIHASTYYGAVVETPIEYIPGYVGAVRIRGRVDIRAGGRTAVEPQSAPML